MQCGSPPAAKDHVGDYGLKLRAPSAGSTSNENKFSFSSIAPFRPFSSSPSSSLFQKKKRRREEEEEEEQTNLEPISEWVRGYGSR